MRARSVGVVLTYHRVSEGRNAQFQSVSPAHFEAQVEALTGLAEVVPVSQVGERSLGRHVAVTFDDGYADFEAVARPILERHQVPATVFVVSSANGTREFWWDRLEHIVLDSSDHPGHLTVTLEGDRLMIDVRSMDGRLRALKALNRRLRSLPLPGIETAMEGIAKQFGFPSDECGAHARLTSSQLRALAGSDLVALGGHTRSHSMLSALAPAAQRDEIVGCRTDLEALAGEARTFAYPYGNPGSYTPATVKIVRDAGFTRAFVNTPGLVRSRTDRYLTPRVMVYDWSGEEFARRIGQWFGGVAAP